MKSTINLKYVGPAAFCLLWASHLAGAQDSPRGSGPIGALNPDLSLDGLFGLAQFNRDNPLTFDKGHDPHQTGFNIQQVELSFTSNVDPYFRTDANLVLTTDGIEIEEAYATTLDLPGNLQFKGGQFFSAFGRHNPTHPHAWEFADKPLVLGRFFGGDGLRNPGVQVSWLTPLPWYSEWIGSIQNSAGDNAPSFLGTAGGKMRNLMDGLALLRWNNFFSVTDEVSLNLGASYAEGKNNIASSTRTHVAGVDVFLKYRKPESLSFISFQMEALQRFYNDPNSSLLFTDWGWYAQTDYRLPGGMERWHVSIRYDFVGPKNAPVDTSHIANDAAQSAQDSAARFRLTPAVTFYPSEFSKLRLQYNYDKPSDFENPQHVAILQLEFVIGAHGAHKF